MLSDSGGRLVILQCRFQSPASRVDSNSSRTITKSEYRTPSAGSPNEDCRDRYPARIPDVPSSAFAWVRRPLTSSATVAGGEPCPGWAWAASAGETASAERTSNVRHVRAIHIFHLAGSGTKHNALEHLAVAIERIGT